MARRNLENALRAGQLIEKGVELPDKFTKLKIINQHKLDQTYGMVMSLQYSFAQSISDVILAVGFENSAIRFYEGLTGNFIREVRKPRYGGEMHIMCLRFHPHEGKNHLLYASTAHGRIYCIDIRDPEITDINEEVILEENNAILNMDFTDRGIDLITCGSDLIVRKYNALTNQLESCWKESTQTQNPEDYAISSTRLFAIKCHPLNPEIFLTGGWDNLVKICNINNTIDAVKRVIHGVKIAGEGIDIKGNEKTNQALILTACDRAKDALQIWDYSSLDLVTTVPFDYSSAEHNGAYLLTAQFCDNNVVIAGGKGTNSMQAIDYKEKKVIGEIKFKQPVYCLDSVFGGRHFAVGSKDGSFVCGELC